jgi:hypothetical protein
MADSLANGHAERNSERFSPSIHVSSRDFPLVEKEKKTKSEALPP